MVVSIFSYTFLPPLAIKSAHLSFHTDLLWCYSLSLQVVFNCQAVYFELIHSIIEYYYRTLLQLLMLKTLWEFIYHDIRCRNCNFILDRSVGIYKYQDKNGVLIASVIPAFWLFHYTIAWFCTTHYCLCSLHGYSYAHSCTLRYTTLHHTLTDCVSLHANYAKIFQLTIWL